MFSLKWEMIIFTTHLILDWLPENNWKQHYSQAKYKLFSLFRAFKDVCIYIQCSITSWDSWPFLSQLTTKSYKIWHTSIEHIQTASLKISKIFDQWKAFHSSNYTKNGYFLNYHDMRLEPVALLVRTFDKIKILCQREAPEVYTGKILDEMRKFSCRKKVTWEGYAKHDRKSNMLNSPTLTHTCLNFWSCCFWLKSTVKRHGNCDAMHNWLVFDGANVSKSTLGRLVNGRQSLSLLLEYNAHVTTTHTAVYSIHMVQYSICIACAYHTAFLVPFLIFLLLSIMSHMDSSLVCNVYIFSPVSGWILIKSIPPQVCIYCLCTLHTYWIHPTSQWLSIITCSIEICSMY